MEKEAKATHLGNAHLYGMLQVTSASLAYIVTQVYLRLAMLWIWLTFNLVGPLCAFLLASILQIRHWFCLRNILFIYLGAVKELKEVNDLLAWWNWYGEVIPALHCTKSAII